MAESFPELACKSIIRGDEKPEIKLSTWSSHNQMIKSTDRHKLLVGGW